MKILTKKRKITKYIVMTAVFVALGYILSFLEIPMPAPITFLKLDFSNVMTMLCGFTLGPVAMVVCEGLKQLLWFFTHAGESAGVGQLGNFIITVSYAIIPSIMYRFKKGRKNVVQWLCVGCLMQVVSALIVNRFITFPLYMDESAAAVFNSVLPYMIVFNIGKALLVSAITFFLYKSLSRSLKYIFGTEESEITEENVISEEEQGENID